jgi:hypothetical protein
MLNFQNRGLFNRSDKASTNSINMNRFNNKTGPRSVDEVAISRLKLKDSIEKARYNSVSSNKSEPKIEKELTREEKNFNHIEAVRNVRRGLNNKF